MRRSGAPTAAMCRWSVRREGINSSRVVVDLVAGSRFRAHAQAVLLQGLTFAGSNVIDLRAAQAALALPVIARRASPTRSRRLQARLAHARARRGRKWVLIESLGPMEPVAGVYVQRAGISPRAYKELIARTAPWHAAGAAAHRAPHCHGESRHRA